MGRASSVLRRTALRGPRAAAFAALLAALVAYYYTRTKLDHHGLWWNIAFLAGVLMPAVFLLVWLVLPVRRVRGLLLLTAALAAAAVACELADLQIPANFLKLFAATLFGFWFLGWFEAVSWVVLIAFIVPWVDAYSVWRGPTHVIVSKHQGVFGALSFAYPVPGRGAAHLGLPDLLFFALFLAASARFRLRPAWTWVGLVTGIALTVVVATAFDVAGLPALPLLSAGFLLPNADLLWSRVRRKA